MGGCFRRTSNRTFPDEQTSSQSNNIDSQTFTNNQIHSQKLPALNISPPGNVRENHDCASSWSPPPTPPIPASLETNDFDQSDHSTNNLINVLLLGESGVGKSTFINAIVNYLTFDTLEQAHSKKPVALMPISFLMTTGDHFEERIVRYGIEDPNEDHNHPGQSVTQHCRSYIFTIGTRGKLRLIDTPGMGDTRGLAQDDLNMQHILSYISNLSHLNAICILLKPNESRLNVVFRSYFSRLIGFLGENVRNNIIFCFTNTRGTFFTPGNTAPLLKEMLDKSPIKHIPFDKSNTYCFDSESFRYLVARENGVKFDDYQKEEYKQSWMTSVNESNRLLQYICSELKPCLQKNWQSVEHAQFRITRMIRPILETTRNILRNIILTRENSSKSQIELYPTALSRSSTICNKCKRVPQQYSDFWILPDELHIYLDKCTKCMCSRRNHINIDYRLDYELLNGANKQSVEEMDRNLDQLKEVMVEFGYFFLSSTQTSEANDPILSFLNQIIEEEKQICQEKDSKCLNAILFKTLNQFKQEYEQRQSILISNRNPINLPRIYGSIQSVSGIGRIKKQIDVMDDVKTLL